MLEEDLFSPVALAPTGTIKLHATVLIGENNTATLPDIYDLHDDVQSQVVTGGEIIGGNRGTETAVEWIVSGTDGCKLTVR